MFTGGFFLGLSRKPGRNGKRNLVAEPHLADWKVLANLAGPTRNREMVQAGADLCIALHRSIETSRGTRDCIRQAIAAGISVWLIEDERGVPKRVQADDKQLAWRTSGSN
jgi:hypothetical protein